MNISKYRSGCALRSLGERRVRDLAVERDDVAAVARARPAPPRRPCGWRPPRRAPRSGARRRRPRSVRRRRPSGLATLDPQVALTAELRDRPFGVVERLAVLVGLVLDRLDALALEGAGEDHCRPAVGRLGLGVRGRWRPRRGRRSHRVPAERLDAADVAVEVPAEHRLARWPSLLTSMIAVRLSRPSQPACSTPPRSSPRPSRCPRTATTPGTGAGRARLPAIAMPTLDRQPLAERAGRDVDPRDQRRRVALQPLPSLRYVSSSRRRSPPTALNTA